MSDIDNDRLKNRRNSPDISFVLQVAALDLDGSNQGSQSQPGANSTKPGKNHSIDSECSIKGQYATCHGGITFHFFREINEAVFSFY